MSSATSPTYSSNKGRQVHGEQRRGVAWEEGVTRPLLLVPKEVGKWRDEKGCGLREGESHTAIISSSNSSRQVRGWEWMPISNSSQGM